ncbi:MAG: hypothetical protein AAFP83_24100, partial [Bacteroidota bacterium]
GHHAFGRVTMSLIGSLCHRKGHYAFGMISIPLAWSPCLWYDLHAVGMISKPLAWSPCLQHGYYASGLPASRTPLLLLKLFAFFVFFAFLAFFGTLTFEFGYGQTDDPGILRTVPNEADMCWLPPLSMADARSFHQKIDSTS